MNRWFHKTKSLLLLLFLAAPHAHTQERTTDDEIYIKKTLAEASLFIGQAFGEDVRKAFDRKSAEMRFEPDTSSIINPQKLKLPPKYELKPSTIKTYQNPITVVTNTTILKSLENKDYRSSDLAWQILISTLPIESGLRKEAITWDNELFNGKTPWRVIHSQRMLFLGLELAPKIRNEAKASQKPSSAPPVSAGTSDDDSPAVSSSSME
jgi:hypothetical protein